MKVDKTFIIKELIKYKNLASKAEFARFIEITPQNLDQWISRGAFNINKIIDKFPEVNQFWLLTGEGEMLKEQKNFIDNSKNIGGDGIIGDNSQMNVNMATEQQNKIELLESKLESANREIELLKGQIELYKDLLNAKK